MFSMCFLLQDMFSQPMKNRLKVGVKKGAMTFGVEKLIQEFTMTLTIYKAKTILSYVKNVKS